MIVTLILLAISFWKPNTGSILFISFAFLLECWIFLANLQKIEVKNENNKYTSKEVEVIKRYRLFFQYPIISRILSRMFSGIQLSVFILVPWLLFKGVYIQALIIGLNYFISQQLALILNPQFFLHNNLDKGKIKNPSVKSKMTEDMYAIDSALEKMYSKSPNTN